MISGSIIGNTCKTDGKKCKVDLLSVILRLVVNQIGKNEL